MSFLKVSSDDLQCSLFKLLLSQILNGEATNSNGLLKCEPSQRIRENPLKYCDQKQGIPVGQVTVGQVTAWGGGSFVPQPVLHCPPHREGAKSNSASGKVGMSAHQTQHDGYFLSFYNVLYLWSWLWQLLRKITAKFDAEQDKKMAVSKSLASGHISGIVMIKNKVFL